MNDYLKKIQKEYGIKMGNYSNPKNRLFNMGILLLKSIEEYIKQIEDNNLTSEQFFLDFCDDLNSLSVKY